MNRTSRLGWILNTQICKLKEYLTVWNGASNKDEESYKNGNWDEKYIHIRKSTNFKTPFSWISGRKDTLYLFTNFINTQEKLQIQ